MQDYLHQIDQLLNEPIDRVREREATAFDQLLAGCHGRLVLFGAGTLGQRSLKTLRQAGIEPLALSDNDRGKWGTQIQGKRVLPPTEAAEEFGGSALFVVTIWSIQHSFVQTRAQLQRLGCLNVIPAAPLRWKYAANLLPDHCMDVPSRIYEQQDEVRQAMRLWMDDQSRREYLEQIRWRTLGDYSCLSAPDSAETEYFDQNLFSLRPDEVFLDCGAYDGDTARRFLKLQPSEFCRLVEIEPDPVNYQKLVCWRNSLAPSIASRIQTHNLAVGAHRGKVRFNAEGTLGSRITEAGTAAVDCIPLDELSCLGEATLIKMDVEGAEVLALNGGKETIRRNQPVLAICLYHLPTDLWRLPLLIHSLAPEHNLFLRHYDYEWDSVCYAIPPQRLRDSR